jgi:hypothetical protein
MKSRDLNDVKEKLNSVGWFIPPYVSSSFLDMVAARIAQAQGNFTQDDLEKALSFVYDAERLASMILYRYRHMPVIEQFTETISESVTAHFFGLNHVAVGGLIPVIEGAGRRLAKDRGIKEGGHIKDVFRSFLWQATQKKMLSIGELVRLTRSLIYSSRFCASLKVTFTPPLRHIR